MTVKQTFLAGAAAAALLLLSGPTLAATACKALNKNQCEASPGCSYVKGYTTKTGTKVSAHCRNKAGSSGKTTAKPGTTDKKKTEKKVEKKTDKKSSTSSK